MKSIILAVEKLIEKAEERREERENIFDEKSEKYQDSDKGEEYREKTELLEELISNLNDFLENSQQ